MSSTIDLVEKKRVLLESIDTGNGPNRIIDERKNEMGADLHKLKVISEALLNNTIIGYHNLNGLRNKIHEVREVFGDLSLDYFVLAETKIKMNKSVNIAKSRQRHDTPLNNFLLHVPNHALRDLFMLN